MAKRCSSGCKYEETRRDRRRPRTPEFLWISIEYEEIRRFKKLRKPKNQNLATQLPYVNRLRTAHREDFLDCETKIWSQSERWNEGSPCERSHMRHIYVCHSSSCSSSWHRTTRRICNLPRISPRNLWDNCFKWLRSWSLTKLKLLITTIGWRAAHVDRDDSADGRAVQFAISKTCVFSDSMLRLGSINTHPIKAWDNTIKMVFGNTFFFF